MYQRVIVPLDGSSEAKQALPYATTLAKAMGARVEVLEAISPFPRELTRTVPVEADALTYPPSPDRWREVQEQGREAARRRLEEAAQELRKAGLVVTVRVEGEDPADAIVYAAQEVPGTLIAISTHGRTGLGRWVLGSVTDKVIRKAETPVLVVRAREKPVSAQAITRVVLPLDGTAISEAALPHAVATAKALGVGITLLRSISPLVYGDTFADYVPSMYADVTAEIDTEVRDYLRQMAERVRTEGVQDVEERAADGYAAASILDEAGAEGDRMVVMATHARSGVGRWILGSVTDRVVRHGSGPVLVVHPKA